MSRKIHSKVTRKLRFRLSGNVRVLLGVHEVMLPLFLSYPSGMEGSDRHCFELKRVYLVYKSLN